MLSRSDTENYLDQGLKRLGIVLENPQEGLARLSWYFQELEKWNKKINLVARTLGPLQILENHFLDSLTLLPLLRREMKEQEAVLDIGTGAGFPGLVLKAACPALPVTLVEPLKKRYYFLKHIIRSLNLSGVEAHNVYLEENFKAEELPAQYFTIVTSRAFTDVGRFIKLSSIYLRAGGRIVMMKGPGLADELTGLTQNNMDGSFQLVEKRKLFLPYSQKERWLVSFARSG